MCVWNWERDGERKTEITEREDAKGSVLLHPSPIRTSKKTGIKRNTSLHIELCACSLQRKKERRLKKESWQHCQRRLTLLLVRSDLLYLPKLLSVVNSCVSHVAPAEGPQTWVGIRSSCLAGEVGRLNRGANGGSRGPKWGAGGGKVGLKGSWGTGADTGQCLPSCLLGSWKKEVAGKRWLVGGDVTEELCYWKKTVREIFKSVHCRCVFSPSLTIFWL